MYALRRLEICALNGYGLRDRWGHEENDGIFNAIDEKLDGDGARLPEVKPPKEQLPSVPRMALMLIVCSK
jgi:hypothetical protein